MEQKDEEKRSRLVPRLQHYGRLGRIGDLAVLPFRPISLFPYTVKRPHILVGNARCGRGYGGYTGTIDNRDA